MKIVTLNTWQERGPWQKRWELILKEMREHRPEVIAFQEMFNPEWAREIYMQLGYRELVFAREPSGLAILSNYPVTRHKCVTMKTRSPTEDYSRYALFAELDTPSGPIACFNTHLSWRIPEGKIREAQVEEMLTIIKEEAPTVPVFSAGDFNSTSDKLEIRKMISKGKFIDLYAALHPKDVGFTWNNINPYIAGSDPKMPDRRVDYIFMRHSEAKESGLRRRRTGGRSAQDDKMSIRIIFNQPDAQGIWPSDHFGLLAEVGE